MRRRWEMRQCFSPRFRRILDRHSTPFNYHQPGPESSHAERMVTSLTHFLGRLGVTMDWRCRRSFLVRLFVPLGLLALLVLTLLVINPQCGRFAYIFQSMVLENAEEG